MRLTGFSENKGTATEDGEEKQKRGRGSVRRRVGVKGEQLEGKRAQRRTDMMEQNR